MDEKVIYQHRSKKMKKQTGVTLIALVITVIVLLILSAVAISRLKGENSVVNNAKNIVDEYNKDVAEEEKNVDDLTQLLDEAVNGKKLKPLEGPANVDENGLAKEDTLILPNKDSNIQIVIPKGFAPVLLKESSSINSLSSLPGQDGSVASILPADQWVNITEEEIKQGIVIVDHAITYDNGNKKGSKSDFNEYVWVSIPESTGFAKIAWVTARIYDEKGGRVDNNKTRKHLISDTIKQFYFYEETNSSQYKRMVSSVAINKGFYIGRYEASRNYSTGGAQSKRGQVVWSNLSQEEANNAAGKSNSNYNMHLMYGIEWDSTLNWLKDNAIISSETKGQTKTMELADLQTDSSTWGNFPNSVGDATNEPYEQEPEPDRGVISEKQKTGASEYWKTNNIYDLAGNVYEFVQEYYYKDGSKYYAYRGGSNYDKATECSAAYRGWRTGKGGTDDLRFPCMFFHRKYVLNDSNNIIGMNKNYELENLT